MLGVSNSHHPPLNRGDIFLHNNSKIYLRLRSCDSTVLIINHLSLFFGTWGMPNKNQGDMEGLGPGSSYRVLLNLSCFFSLIHVHPEGKWSGTRKGRKFCLEKFITNYEGQFTFRWTRFHNKVTIQN